MLTCAHKCINSDYNSYIVYSIYTIYSIYILYSSGNGVIRRAIECQMGDFGSG